MNEIRAIETRYKGYRFRSRLEARWAVFFEAAGLKWEYEPEGYHLPSGDYLPDFFLPEIQTWIEVKPDVDLGARPTDLIGELAEHTGNRAMIVRGMPLQGASQHGVLYDPPGFSDGSAYWMFWDTQSSDGAYLFCVCPDCGKIGIEFDGRGARVCGSKCTSRSPHKDDKAYSSLHPILVNAANAAKSARFERGEAP